MKYEDIRTFLTFLGVKKIEHGGQWARASCPLAHWNHKHGKDTHPSFGIKIEEHGRSFYNCWACSNGGSLSDLLVELLHYNKNSEVQMELPLAFKMIAADEEQGYHQLPDWKEFEPITNAAKFQPWPEWWVSSFMLAWNFSASRQYLKDREVTSALAAAFEIRYDHMRNAVGFPFRAADGRLAGMRGRYVNPVGEMRYHDYDYQGVSNSSVVWFNEHRVDWSKPVVITESAFDAVAIYRWYRNVISPLSVGMSVGKIDRLKNAVEVVCFFDNDEGGKRATAKVREKIGKTTVVREVKYPDHIVPQWKDANALTPLWVSSMLSEFVVLDAVVVDSEGG